MNGTKQYHDIQIYFEDMGEFRNDDFGYCFCLNGRS